ncbi:MAG: class I SAM-dependent methyltransferase, partial [Nitrospinaceae bacterium]|nr:class I SAM-dependent methyltransferase [Nitrospinaceae bacterium]NIR54498.1 class I SAM-dependent methyltransferase [Nitrospinaceae bacterium]NIS84917.1 class I SAM-dependent methyltransferase [Nitrospinaceae bacterium]NIT81731.1 class I SAM-dependent methyltransferase [Nitrospinaceae bacterium]NIU44000.1 class I SAM-dependent methyltransferase [Nitrospinaceae bacterium]
MPCSLCGTRADFWLSDADREYWSCPCCALIFVPARYFLSRDEEKKRYLLHENSLANEGYVKMFQDKIRILRSACPGVRTALDYGCGYAPVLQTLLRREGIRTDVYDSMFYPEMPAPAAYDLVISTETFE